MDTGTIAAHSGGEKGYFWCSRSSFNPNSKTAHISPFIARKFFSARRVISSNMARGIRRVICAIFCFLFMGDMIDGLGS